MGGRRVRTGLGTLAVATALLACGGSPVPIETAAAGTGTCYTSGVTGDLVIDPTAGGITVINSMSGKGPLVRWPTGWTGRSSGPEVEIINRRGQVAYRTGSHVDLMGGYGPDGVFEVCGLELL